MTELPAVGSTPHMFESFLSFASQIVAPWLVYCLCVFSMEHGGYSQQPHTALLCLPLLAPAAQSDWSSWSSQSSAGVRTTHTALPVSLTTRPRSCSTQQTRHHLGLSSLTSTRKSKPQPHIQLRSSNVSVWTVVWSHHSCGLSVALA